MIAVPMQCSIGVPSVYTGSYYSINGICVPIKLRR